MRGVSVNRAYLRAAERLDRDGARIRRLVLDYESKRDYQRFRHRQHRQPREDDGTLERHCRSGDI